MKLSTTFVSLALFVSFSVAAPAPKKVLPMSSAARQGRAVAGAVGAAYFITNEADANFVISADIKSDGTLALSRAIATGGRGLTGVTDPASKGPDGLFSQGSIKASKTGEFLVAVNPGSNTISSFAIDAANPSILKKMGDVVSSEGEFPMSLVINKAGSRVCVLNGGAVNGVNCYSVDKTLGLTAIQGSLRSLELNQTTPANGPAGTTSHILFSEDETKLMANVKGIPPQPGFMAIWDVDANGGLSAEFAKLAPPSGGLLPFGMSLIPGKNAAIVTDPGIGFDIFDFGNATQAGQQVTASGASSANKVDGQTAVCWSSRSEKTSNFYLTDIGTSQVTEVNVDDNLKPTIVKQYPQDAGSGTIDTDIASVNNNDFLYVLGANKTQISVLALNAPGQATQKQVLDIGTPAKAAGLTVSPSVQGMTTFLKA